MEPGIGKGVGDAVAYHAKQFTDLHVGLIKGILNEVTGSRELAVELFNASWRDLELIDQLVIHGKTTQGVDRTTVKPGETVSWKACKGSWTLFGTQVFTAFKPKGDDCFILLCNECPLTAGAKAYSSVKLENGTPVNLQSYYYDHEARAHSNHQKSKNGDL